MKAIRVKLYQESASYRKPTSFKVKETRLGYRERMTKINISILE